MYSKTETYEIPEKIIPATIGYKKVFYADDGTYFQDDERACRVYEKKKQLEKIQVFRTEISGNNKCFELEEEYAAKFFYIRNLEELYELVDNGQLVLYYNTSGATSYIDTEYCDFTLYGEGWYIIWQNHGGDWDDDWYCMNWEQYIKKHIERVNNYKINVEEMFKEKEKDFKGEKN